ncbi:MAG TPA: glycoside hydrolase family 88 protein [Verrucomicrobiae bacterium]
MNYPQWKYCFVALCCLTITAGCVSGQDRAKDSGGISNTEIRETVLRIAHHQIRPLSDGDYPTNLDDAKTAKAPEGIGWTYPWGVTLLGMERTAEVLGDPESDQFVVQHNLICGRYYHWLAGLEKQYGAAATNFTYSTKLGELMSLGKLDYCGAMGTEMIESVMDHNNEISPDEQEVLARATDWVTHQQSRLPDGTLWRPEVDGGTVWPDDLYMGGTFQVHDGMYTHDQTLIDDTARQIIHQAALEQDSDGIWYHGYFMAQKQHAPFKWGRGNGWVMVTLVETLSAMPENDPLKPQLIAILQKQINGLEKVQAPDGMWRQVLDKPELWEETSCTAMFAYGIARAVNRGWIAPENMTVARRAFAGIAKNVGADGSVHGTCEGTSIGTTLDFYINRKRNADDLHGRGPVMLAGTEILSAKN